jgi:transcriptional regulator with PAS, ATPase and Fis domain
MELEFGTADLNLSVAESKSLLKVVFAAFQDGIAIYGANGELLSHNAAWIRLMGDWHNGSLGKSVRDAARVSGYKGPSSFYRAIRSGLPESILINTRHDVVLVTATPHFVGEILQHVVIIARNLTQLASLKDQLESQRAGTCTRVEDARTEHLKSILETAGLSNIIVAGSSFRNLLLLVSQVAMLDATVLLYGETGTGKGVVAKVLHRLSRRADKPFIEVNCGAIPDSLAESELFGYQPGAFTDSLRGGKKGQIELANKGTLFLDEVSELSISSQVKLLKFLLYWVRPVLIVSSYPSQCRSLRFSGIIKSIDLPTISSARKPKILSAPAFHSRTLPSTSPKMTASPALSTICPQSHWWVYSAIFGYLPIYRARVSHPALARSSSRQVSLSFG